MSSDDLKLISIRTMVETDVPYIYSSWLEDYLSGHHIKTKDNNRDKTFQTFVALMPRDLYFKEQRSRIDKILKKSKVFIACNSEDEDQIFGYVVHRMIGDISLLSWAYVRPVYRGFGICNLLMKRIGDVDVLTHITPQKRWFLKKYNTIYNPFMETIDDQRS